MNKIDLRVTEIAERLLDAYGAERNVQNDLLNPDLDYKVSVRPGSTAYNLEMILEAEDSRITRFLISTELVLSGTDEEIDEYIQGIISSDSGDSMDYDQEYQDYIKDPEFDKFINSLTDAMDSCNCEDCIAIDSENPDLAEAVMELEERVQYLESLLNPDFDDFDDFDDWEDDDNYEDDDYVTLDDYETLEEYIQAINDLKAQLILEELIETCQKRGLNYLYNTDYQIHINEIDDLSTRMEILFENIESPVNSILISIPKEVFYRGSNEDLKDYVNYIIREIQMRELQDDLFKLNDNPNIEEHNPDIISEFVLNYLNQFRKF